MSGAFSFLDLGKTLFVYDNQDHKHEKRQRHEWDIYKPKTFDEFLEARDGAGWARDEFDTKELLVVMEDRDHAAHDGEYECIIPDLVGLFANECDGRDYGDRVHGDALVPAEHAWREADQFRVNETTKKPAERD